MEQPHQYLTTLLPHSWHSLRYCCALGSWPAPAPHLAHMEHSGSERRETAPGLALKGGTGSSLSIPRLWLLPTLLVKAARGYQGVQPSPAQLGQRQGSSAAPACSPFLMSQHPAGLAWDARVVRGPNTTPAPPSLLCSLQLLRAAAALPFSHPSGHISALAGSLAGFVVPLCQLCSHQRLPGHLETPSSTQYCYCAKWELYSFLVVGVFFCYFFLNQLRRRL